MPKNQNQIRIRSSRPQTAKPIVSQGPKNIIQGERDNLKSARKRVLAENEEEKSEDEIIED